MNYKILGQDHGGRFGKFDDFSINRSAIAFNGKYIGKEWVTFAVNDDGFLCFCFTKTNASYHIRFVETRGYVRVSNEIRSMFAQGSYSVTDTDGEWYISDCHVL